ncbi:ABC transporter permease [Paenibacillus caui]|uniref:ABC transporter permease n=1 Tax=Paenibacillus caui TaxID=2873927 RepID=UPI001CA843D0|nr:ABC transporter permease [Paenibacillus caui]
MKPKTSGKSDGRKWHGTVLGVLLVYLFLPVAGTLLFSLARQWQDGILPDGYTLQWYGSIFTDGRFLAAVGRTLLVGVITVIVTLALMVPVIFVLNVYFPKWERLLQISVLLPFAFPPVVSAIGLIKMYSSGPVAITGTVWILIGVYFIMIQPFIYQSVRNSLSTINAKDLVEAAEMLGASRMAAFRRVILPNILPGTLVASLLSFSMIFGEFVMSRMLVGGQFETVQMYLYNQMNTSGQAASAVVVTYFALILVLSGLVLKLGAWKPKGYRSAQVEEE